MNSRNNENDISGVNDGICPVSGLHVESVPGFNDVHILEDYYTSLKKVGDSIVFIQSRGNLKNYDLDKFNDLVESFCKAAGVKKPYVQIRNLSYVTGRMPFRTMKRQILYFQKHQDLISGLIFIKQPSWFEPFIKQGKRLIRPALPMYSVDSYAEAIEAAVNILAGRKNVETYMRTRIDKDFLCFENVLFKPEWEYKSSKTDFIFRTGCIPERILYISVNGELSNTEDIDNALSLSERVSKDNGLIGIPYVLADYSNLTNVRSVKLRHHWVKTVRKVSAATGNLDAAQIIINPDSLNRIAIKLFASFFDSQLIVVDSINEAFEIINNNLSIVKKETGLISVTPDQLEEFSNMMGMLLWEDPDTLPEIKLSPGNPLAYLSETVELLRADLNEMRENERKLQEDRLKESEKNRDRMIEILKDTEASKAALEKEEESRRILLDNIRTQVWYLIDEHTYGAVNKAHADFYGMRIEDMSYKSFYDIFPRIIADERRQFNRDVFKAGKNAEFEQRTRNASGEQRLLAVTQTPKLREDGTVEYVVCSAEDITESKLAEDKLRQLALAIEQSPATVVITDTEGRIIYANPKFEETTGYSVAEAIGQNPRILKSGRTGYEEYTQLWDTISSGKEWHGEFYNKRKDGNMYWESASISPIFDESGKITHYLAVKEDISDRKKAEQELLESNQQLEESIGMANLLATRAEQASQAKSEFLANMSHEIRTPMNGIIGMSELLLDTKLSEEQRHFAGIIRAGGHALMGIINDILDFSKIEAGKLDLQIQNFDLQVLLDEIIAEMTLRAKEKGLELICETDSDVPTYLRGDPGRLRQILTNLIGNAVKFTDKGKITIRITRQKSDESTRISEDDTKSISDDNVVNSDNIKISNAESVCTNLEADENSTDFCILCFSVHDTGIGIPAEKMDKLFSKFSQVDSSMTRKYGGAGLGLAISKELVELMGGYITADSCLGQGSEFRFTVRFKLPLPSEDKGKLFLECPVERRSGKDAISVQSGNRKTKILLVEDNLSNQQVVLGILKSAGISADVVDNGKKAVDAVKTGGYDLVLMDLQMPEMDGLEATRVIRAFESDKKKDDVRNSDKEYKAIPIIAITAHAMKGDRDKCLEAGMNDYLAKPLSPVKLIEIMGKWLPPEIEKCEFENYQSTDVPALSSDADESKFGHKSFSELPVFDREGMLKRLMRNNDLAEKVLQSFIEEIPLNIKALDICIEERDAVGAARQAHTIKGASAGVGAEMLRALAHEMEIAANTGDFEKMKSCMLEIEESYKLFKKQIK